MNRWRQFLFIVSVLALVWYGMMAVHELGHVLGAVVTNGSVERVVLHPLTISRTDVSPNPYPAAVVWLGPILGCVFPLVGYALVPKRITGAKNLAGLFAGFCLLANGANISIGSFDRIGDCAEMLRTGTPQWVMILFGVVSMPLGFCIWHRLGSLRDFVTNPTIISPRAAYGAFSLALIAVGAGFVLSPEQ